MKTNRLSSLRNNVPNLLNSNEQMAAAYDWSDITKCSSFPAPKIERIRMMRIVTLIVIFGAIAFSIAFAEEANTETESHGMTESANMFTTNQCFSKGGLGIVNKSLYIVVKSARSGKNELIIKPTEETEWTWKGRSVAKSEFVIFYGGKIWTAENLPDRFDLSKAIVISFEMDKVRFFDFQEMSGGYYERIRVDGER